MARVWSGVTERLTGDSIPAISELYGRPFFVGIGSANTSTIQSFDKYSDIRGRIGYGPLTRQLEDYFACGGQESKAFAYVLAADDAGAAGAVTHTGTGTGVVTVSGSATDAYSAILTVLVGGARGTATFKYSLDGGYSWSAKTTTAATVALGISGITAAFTSGAEVTYVAGDTYTFSTTAPACDADTYLDAMDDVLDSYRHRFEFFVVVGPAIDTFWSGVGSLMAQEFSAHNPIFTLMEAEPIDSATKDADIAALIADASGFTSRYVAVVAGGVRFSSSKGELLPRTPIGCVAGILSKGKVSDSIGVIRDEFGLIQGGTALEPSSLTLGDMELLMDAGFTVPKWYEGYPGLFFNNGNLMSAPGDPFCDIEHIRVAGKLIRLCRVAALRTLHLDADSTANWAFGGQSGLKYLEAELQRAADPMLVAGEVYRFKPIVISTPDQVYDSGTVTVRLDFTTNPKMKAIELVFDLVSPDEFERRNG